MKEKNNREERSFIFMRVDSFAKLIQPGNFLFDKIDVDKSQIKGLKGDVSDHEFI
jgi:hypothetical protein